MTSIYIKIDDSQYLNADKYAPTVRSEMASMLCADATTLTNKNNFKHIHDNVARKERSQGIKYINMWRNEKGTKYWKMALYNLTPQI